MYPNETSVRGQLSRRSFLGAATACLSAAVLPVAQQPAQPVPRVKGPRVWLDMDQAELDAAYDQSCLCAEPATDRQALRHQQRDVRTRLGAPQRYAYGTTPIEGLDIYMTKRPNAPINIFIHGGAWRVEVAKNNAFPAEMFVHAGAHYVVPDFAWVQDVGGSLMPMAEQVRRAVAWVHRNAKSFGGDSDRIYVSGHSSGGHLAGVILTTTGPRTSICRPTP
jgi:arylformamidase